MLPIDVDADASALYGANYYASGCGPIPYERSAHWVNFFSVVADQLIRALNPQKVLDAGCAMGFLVEAFWDRGVYCEGIDVSEYAISKVRSDIAEYCSVKSITEFMDRKFDLVTCIEVLEHLPPQQSRAAVENLCKYADTILFSSTPSDFDEPTHLNVRPTIYWLQLFNEFDFWPDGRFDASFLTPHAMLLRRNYPGKEAFLPLFSDLVRYRMGFIECSSRSRAVEEKDVELARLHEQLTVAVEERRRALSELSHHQQMLESSQEALRACKSELAVTAFGFQDRDRLIRQFRTTEQSLLDRVSALEHEVSETQRLAAECARVQATLTQVLSSRAWRAAEMLRKPLRIVRRSLRRILAGRNH